MAFTKITTSDLNSRGATTLPNQPKISATALKQEFDAPAKNVVAPKVNNLIDELEATSAAASLGATAPTGRSGNTVQAVMNKLSTDLKTVEDGMSEAIQDAHTHDNKALLDTYEQTETDLADAVDKKHEHSNLALLETYTQTEANLSDAVDKKHTHSNKSLLDSYDQSNSDIEDAVSKKHSHSNKSLLDTYTQTESDLSDAVSKKHTHSNKAVIDKFGEDSSGNPTYDGNPIGGGGGGGTDSNAYHKGDTAETTLADDDYVPFYDTSATATRKSLWSNIKSVLKTYFDTLYQAVGNYIETSSTSGLVKNDGTIDTNTYLTSTDIADKANKVSGGTSGNFAGLDSNGDLTDSGKKASDFQAAGNYVSHTASTAVGSATQGVYVASDGTATPMTYELNKTVPSNAVFTDTWTALVGATAQANGTAGYAPQPLIADKDKFLKGDGTWDTPSGGGGTYLESSSGTTSSGITTFSFTNAAISSNKQYDYYADVFGVVPIDAQISGTTMSVMFDANDNVTKCGIRIWG